MKIVGKVIRTWIEEDGKHAEIEYNNIPHVADCPNTKEDHYACPQPVARHKHKDCPQPRRLNRPEFNEPWHGDFQTDGVVWCSTGSICHLPPIKE